MSKPIPPLDLMWLLMESQASPTHVGALLLFEKPKRRPNCVREIVTAYRSYAPTPPFNYIPELRRTRMPRFQEARTYDPQYHNQHIALPAASTYADLLRLVADLHESMLDRDRPLFRNWIIDCVPDDRFALYVKVHHAIVDGVSGTKRLYSSLGANDRHAILRPALPLNCRCASLARPRLWSIGSQHSASVRPSRPSPSGRCRSARSRSGSRRCWARTRWGAPRLRPIAAR